MDKMYLHQRFSRAVNSMAASQKSIQERIADAYIDQLIDLKPDELPEEIRFQFTELKNSLTSVKPNGYLGSIAATTSQMSEEKAIETAQKIENMNDWIIRWNPPTK